MSPLAQLLLRVLRSGSIAAAAFMALVIAIELWKLWRFGVEGTLTTQHASFMAILVLMLLGFLWLARAIGREIRKSGS